MSDITVEQVDEPTEEASFVMSYEDVEGNRHEEPACPRCISHHSWTADEKGVIERALQFHVLAEDYDVALWRKRLSRV